MWDYLLHNKLTGYRKHTGDLHSINQYQVRNVYTSDSHCIQEKKYRKTCFYYTFYIEKYNPKHIIYKVKSLCSYLTVEKRQTYNLIDWFFLPAETFQIQMDPLLSSINYLSLRKYIIEFSYFGLLPLSLQDYRLAVLLLLHWPTVSKSLNYDWAQVLLGVSCIFQSNGRIYLFKISATYGLQSRYPIFPQKSTYTEYTFFLNWKKNRSRYPICTLCWGSR